jgi:hypothetical protein
VAFICAVFFVTSFFSTQDVSHLFQSTLVVIVLLLNILVIGWDTKKYQRELHDKAGYLSKRINDLLSNEEDMEYWTNGHFLPQLYLPHSPCISLQWTIRDGKTVNLPTVLLVKGDIIRMCPGMPAPGMCENLEAFGYAESMRPPKTVKLNHGELFIPVVDVVSSNPETFSSQARFRKIVTPVKFVMMETIYVKHLKMCLEKSTTRPRSLYDKERHGILSLYIESIITPAAAVLLLIVCYLRYSHFRDKESDITWTELNRTLLRMSLVIFPLVPFSLPISWIILNALGVSRIVHLCPSGTSGEGILPAVRLRGKLVGGKDLAFFDDVDTEIGSDVTEAVIQDTFTDTRSWTQVFESVIQLLKNNEGYLWRSGNVVQALGSMTALSCVDKKGILSWPNPTADKVFFLTKASSSQTRFQHKKMSMMSDVMSPSSQEESVSGEAGSEEKLIINSNMNEPNSSKKRRRRNRGKYQSRPHVLDVTHDPHSLFSEIEFDDPNWQVFLPNVKPLGLAILLNTCNPEAQEEYTKFCDHISCQAYSTENNVIPVVNKRCLCHLSHQIGFTDSAVKDYEYIAQLTMYRHVMTPVIQGKQLLSISMQIPRLKMPFPHVASSLIRDKTSNTYQLFSQGTGDLILDACVEYWNGSDLRILTASDRKRILDFYHRSSLTAYCMAFSYVPLASVSPEQKTFLKDYTLELTPENPVVDALPGANVGLLGFRKTDFLSEGRETDSQSRISGTQYLSNESLARPLLDSPSKDSMTHHPESGVQMDADSIAAQMNNQVFIGMVSMQYQACPDFVQLVEQLEKACIRFVHFSKENELRSRVFSEKMGLEAGWNCHISLHSETPPVDEKDKEKNDQDHGGILGSKMSLLEAPNNHGVSNILRSQSAPCAVNLDSCVVKFAETPKESQTISPAKVVIVTQEEMDSSSSSSGSSSESETDPLHSKADRKMSHASYASPSPSRITDSTGTETAGVTGQTTTTIAFDVLNRAKLPKGIENIRPHLQEVDNVPLLVSLFTDCTAETTCQMIEIMQDYGEVVCVLGSSANISNIPIFLEANASIAIEPLYPEVCVTQPMFEGTIHDVKVSNSFMSPTNLAKHLISLPCSLLIPRDDPVGLDRLIMESRTFMNNIRNSLQFLLCCSLSLSLVQLLGSLMLLPPLLTSGQVLFLVFLILPVMSFTLMSSPPDPHVMTVATGKNLNLTRESVIYFLLCYLIKFTPSMLIIVFVFLWILTTFCTDRDPNEGWDFFLDLR